MELIDIIERHLQTSRRIVIPTFGAFVVKDEENIIFSELLQTDDGILRGLLANEGLGEIESAGVINRFIFEVKYGIDNTGYYDAGSFGRFFRADDGSIRFRKIQKSRPIVQRPISQPENTTKPASPDQQLSIDVNPTTNTVEPKPTEQNIHQPKPAAKPTQVRKNLPTKKSRKGGVDVFMIIAVVVIVLALIAIAFGLYNTKPAESEEAAMDALRIPITEQVDTTN